MDWGMHKALGGRAASWQRDGGHKDGRQEAPQVHRIISTAGKTRQVKLRGGRYTDVVTRSVAWLTSFLFESSPLAAFMSFRKFSTVFFMFFNSPGCGVARLWSVLCKQTEARVFGFIHYCFKAHSFEALAFQHKFYNFRNPSSRGNSFLHSYVHSGAAG